jgi:hypothetical protein
LEQAPDELKERRILWQDNDFYYTLEGGRIGREVALKNIAPSAVIGPGTVLTGSQTCVGAHSRLIRVVAEDLEAGEEVTLTLVRALGAKVGDRVKLTWAKLGDGTRIGKETVGAYVAVHSSVVGDRNTLHPFALIVDSATATKNIVGGWLIKSQTQPGYMNMHPTTASMGVRHRPVTFIIGGRTYDLGAASLNAAGGLLMGSDRRGAEPVEITSAFPLSNAAIGPRAKIGAFSKLHRIGTHFDGFVGVLGNF